jgi:chromosome segregation ATPase
MSTIDTELKDLKAAREQIEKDIASASKTLQETQAKLGEANSQRASLLTKIAAAEKAATELEGTKKAGKAERDKVAKELADTQAAFDDLQKRLSAELPAERRAAIAGAVTKIDGAISDARTDAANAQKKTADAEAAAADARKKAAAAEADSKQPSEELKNWPKSVENARGQMTKLIADAKAALEDGRVNEAYLKLLELKDAVATVQNISSQANEDKIAKAFKDKAKAADTAASDAATAADALNKQKTAQATAEAELKKREQGRSADLKTALAELPLVIAASPPPDPGGETPKAAPEAG